MTSEEITELFIHAAEVDRRLPDTARPAKVKGQSLPYVHDYKDMAGWGTERLEEERQGFWDSRSTRLKTQDIADWEKCNELILLVPDESQRRCLWNWAIAKARGRSFSKWCRSQEGIHAETGSRRKNRAIASITFALSRNTLQNNEIDLWGLLPVAAEIDHIPVNITTDAPKRKFCIMAEGAFNPVFSNENNDFSWAEKRNQLRREKDKRRKAA